MNNPWLDAVKEAGRQIRSAKYKPTYVIMPRGLALKHYNWLKQRDMVNRLANRFRKPRSKVSAMMWTNVDSTGNETLMVGNPFEISILGSGDLNL